MTYNGTIIYSTAVKRPAKRVSFAEVTCPLQHETKRTKRAALQNQEGSYVARGYSVSISNDAISFGDTDSMVVFDSTCVNCTKIGIDIVCTKDVRFIFYYFQRIGKILKH